MTEIRAKFVQDPPPKGTEISAFRAEIKDFPEEWQGIMLGLFTHGIELGAEVKNADRMKFIRDTIYSGIGFLLILAGAAMTYIHQDMTPEQANASAVVMSAGLAAFLVFLPGFLKLTGAMKENENFESLRFKAGGGIAIFIFTFLLLRLGFKL